jgi:tRNA A37 threonylcarbamoyladenosine biosynthesis protein TsaE
MEGRMSDITLSDKQAEALRAAKDWFKTDTAIQQTFSIAGYAGTGKSTIVKSLVDDLGLDDSEVVFAAYTGKAAFVLRQKGTPARTIHSLIYRVFEVNEAEIAEARRKLEELETAALKLDRAERLTADAEIAGLRLQLKEMRQPRFGLNEESEVRNAKLVVLDECFVASTMVNTPTGLRCISDLRVGDFVINAAGIDRVVATNKREVTSVVQIEFGGKTAACSRNHPFFTERGLVIAGKLRPGDRLLSTAAAMRLLWNGFCSPQQLDPKILRSDMFLAIADAQSKVWRSSSAMAAIRLPKGSGRDRKDSCSQSGVATGSGGQNQRPTPGNGLEAANTRGQWPWPDSAAEPAVAVPGRQVAPGTGGFLGKEATRIPDTLQARFGKPGSDDSDRVGRPFSLVSVQETKRSEEDQTANFFRVERVEVLEQGDPRLDRFRDAGGKLHLYDIQAERHHSFSVEVALVHNCSMVGDDMAADVLSFGKPVLVLGDPGQLPPVKGTGAFHRRDPDVMLTDIHRQAETSAVIRLATMARQGEPIPYGQHDDFVWKMSGRDVTPEELLQGGQVICGKNVTRLGLNNAMRRAAGFGGSLPTGPGEKVICLRNNAAIGLLNGMFIELDDIERIDEERFRAAITTEEGDLVGGRDKTGKPNRLPIYAGHFLDHQKLDPQRDERDWRIKKRLIEATWGWVVTCHKFQGSSALNVIVIDDGWGRTREDRCRWLYTAITRAEEGLVILD